MAMHRPIFPEDLLYILVLLNSMSNPKSIPFIIMLVILYFILIIPSNGSGDTDFYNVPIHQFIITNVSQYEFFPGEINIINITIKNVRENSVFEVTSNMASTKPVQIKKELTKYRQGELRQNQEYTFQYEYYIVNDASKGVYNLPLSVLWTTVEGGVIQKQEDLIIGIEIIENPEDPKIDIINITTIPEQIKPGDNFELKVILKNIGKNKLNQIKAGMNVDIPFSSVGSSTQQNIPLIESGQSAEVIFNLRVDKQAISRLYNFNFTLEYMDINNKEKYQASSFGIDIKEISQVYIQDVTLEPTLLAPDTEGLLLIQIANAGTNEINNVRINILGGENILTQTQNFIGIVRPGVSAIETTSFGVWVNPDIETGNYGLNIQINYDDINDIRQSNSNLYIVKVDEKASIIPVSQEILTGIIYTFLFALMTYGIFIIVGFQINKKK
jgi:hypothetical protein